MIGGNIFRFDCVLLFRSFTNKNFSSFRCKWSWLARSVLPESLVFRKLRLLFSNLMLLAVKRGLFPVSCLVGHIWCLILLRSDDFFLLGSHPRETIRRVYAHFRKASDGCDESTGFCFYGCCICSVAGERHRSGIYALCFL